MRSKALLLIALATSLAVLLLIRLWSPRTLRFAIGNTSCMSPTLNQGEIVVVRPFDGKVKPLRRFDIVVFRSPIDPKTTWVMRVVGLSGERIEIRTNALAIGGSEVEQDALPQVLRGRAWLSTAHLRSQPLHECFLREGEIFVIGDHLDTANDSRYWGALSLSAVVGVVEKKTTGKQMTIAIPSPW